MPAQTSNRTHRTPPRIATLAALVVFAASGCATIGADSTAVAPAQSVVSPTTVAHADVIDSSAAAAQPAATGVAPASADNHSEETRDADDAVPAATATSGAHRGVDDATADTGAPTDAERDFDALYGAYDPVADPTLPAAAQMPGVYDPWERYNRSMHRFNNAVDRTIARPLAKFYVAVAPRAVRLGISNFFSNLGQPVTAVNALLQGHPAQAGRALGRLIINTTLGIGGIFDPASDAQLDRRSEDFGQTLGVWGWERSRYVELPLFGPRTVRDVFGMVGDAPLSPLRQVEEDKIRIPLQGLQLVDIRAQLLSTDSLREGAADDYALVRDAWMQRRNYQIYGDRMGGNTEDLLPEYLRDDDNPLVPASAMPVMPTDN